MIRRLVMTMFAVTLSTAAFAEDGASPTRKPAPQSLKFLADRQVAIRDFRIDTGLVGDEAGPGDHPTSELVQMGQPNLPREPGAPVKARMSMSLDDGDDGFRPAFSLGGVGAVLVQLTDALLDR